MKERSRPYLRSLDIYGRLDSDFYEPRNATLTPAVQDLLAAAACSYPPLRPAELNSASEKTPDKNKNNTLPSFLAL